MQYSVTIAFRQATGSNVAFLYKVCSIPIFFKTFWNDSLTCNSFYWPRTNERTFRCLAATKVAYHQAYLPHDCLFSGCFIGSFATNRQTIRFTGLLKDVYLWNCWINIFYSPLYSSQTSRKCCFGVNEILFPIKKSKSETLKASSHKSNRLRKTHKNAPPPPLEAYRRPDWCNYLSNNPSPPYHAFSNQ